jgi:hypothetical protein
VARLLGEARTRATEVIRRERASLDALAAELVSREVVDARRLDEIFAGQRGAGVDGDGPPPPDRASDGNEKQGASGSPGPAASAQR